MSFVFFFFFSSRRRHTRCSRDWSSDVCSSDLGEEDEPDPEGVLLVLGEPRDVVVLDVHVERRRSPGDLLADVAEADRKSTRLNSSHGYISYAVFCLKKKKRTRST